VLTSNRAPGPDADTENQTSSFAENSPAFKKPRLENSPAKDSSNSFRSLLQLDVNNNHTSTPSPSTAVDVALSCPRPSQSKADGAVLQCPLTANMYKDPNLLRKAHQGLLGFIRLVETLLKEMEVAEDRTHKDRRSNIVLV